MAIQSAQLVTVALLDARFAAFEAKLEVRFSALETKMERVNSELVRWVFLVMLGNVAMTAGITAVLNALQR
jgi:hypothetical protein